MNTLSMTGMFGSVGAILLVVWGLNWYCGNENTKGWIAEDLCPIAAPLHEATNKVVQWFAGLFDKGTKTAAPKAPTSMAPADVWDGAGTARYRSCGSGVSDAGRLLGTEGWRYG